MGDIERLLAIVQGEDDTAIASVQVLHARAATSRMAPTWATVTTTLGHLRALVAATPAPEPVVAAEYSGETCGATLVSAGRTVQCNLGAGHLLHRADGHRWSEPQTCESWLASGSCEYADRAAEAMREQCALACDDVAGDHRTELARGIAGGWTATELAWLRGQVAASTRLAAAIRALPAAEGAPARVCPVCDGKLVPCSRCVECGTLSLGVPAAEGAPVLCGASTYHEGRAVSCELPQGHAAHVPHRGTYDLAPTPPTTEPRVGVRALTEQAGLNQDIRAKGSKP